MGLGTSIANERKHNRVIEVDLFIVNGELEQDLDGSVVMIFEVIILKEALLEFSSFV